MKSRCQLASSEDNFGVRPGWSFLSLREGHDQHLNFEVILIFISSTSSVLEDGLNCVPLLFMKSIHISWHIISWRPQYVNFLEPLYEKLVKFVIFLFFKFSSHTRSFCFLLRR